MAFNDKPLTDKAKTKADWKLRDIKIDWSSGTGYGTGTGGAGGAGGAGVDSVARRSGAYDFSTGAPERLVKAENDIAILAKQMQEMWHLLNILEKENQRLQQERDAILTGRSLTDIVLDLQKDEL